MGGSLTKSSPERRQESTTQQATPWSPALPAVQGLLTSASNLQAANPSGMGAVTSEALQGLADRARQGISPTAQAGQDWLQGFLSGPGSGQITTEGQYAGMQPQYAANLNRTIGLGNEAKGPSYAEQNLGGVARGEYLSGSNPYLDDLINRSASDAANDVAARFAASGRYGSGSFAGAIAKSTGDIATKTRAEQYNLERQRQAEANQLLESQMMGRLGFRGTMAGQELNSLQGAKGLIDSITGVQAGNADIASRDAGQRLQAAGMLPQMEAMSYAPWQNMLAAGQSIDQAPWQQLGLQSQIVQPLASAYGTTTGNSNGTTQMAQASILQQLLGAAIGAGSTAAKFYNPAGVKV